MPPKHISVIKSTVLRRIIMHSGGKDLVLFEGKLAQEFGVSRTPIRQVMQALASEWLVEVKSGIGTVVAPLLPERRLNDIKAFSVALRTCAECTSDTQTIRASIEIATIRTHLEQSKDRLESDPYFEASTMFANCLADLVDDGILRDALIACYWRFVRRRMADHKGDLDLAVKELVRLAKDAEYGAQGGQAEGILRMVSGTVEGLAETA